MDDVGGKKQKDAPGPLLYGLLPGLGATGLWGLIYLVPDRLPSYGAFDLPVWRYVVYGVLSGVLALALGSRMRTLPASAWWRSGVLGLFGNVVFYTLIVAGANLAGAGTAAVALGALPVTLAIYGNAHEGSLTFSRLVPPLLLILVGVLLFDAPRLGALESGTKTTLGLLADFSAVALWTWFAGQNALFLRRNPGIDSTAWSAALGITTFLAMLPLAAIAAGFGGLTGPWSGSTFGPLILGALVLGVVCSFLAAALWNVASRALPVAISGQLIAFESVCGVGYVHLAHHTWPIPAEIAGTVLVMAGVSIGVRALRE